MRIGSLCGLRLVLGEGSKSWEDRGWRAIVSLGQDLPWRIAGDSVAVAVVQRTGRRWAAGDKMS